MGTELEKPREEVPAPSRNVHINWWWGIYLFGTGGVPLLWELGHSRFSDPLVWIFTPLLYAATIPIGFGYDFGLLCGNLLYRLGLDWDSAANWEGFFTVVGVPLGYVIFIVHYRLTSKAKTRRAFLLLMLSLVLLILGSLIGFVCSLRQAITNG